MKRYVTFITLDMKLAGSTFLVRNSKVFKNNEAYNKCTPKVGCSKTKECYIFLNQEFE